jgi:glyoxylase-like metal-dependent hydrolase (beta-lactamase superfamily II)
VRLGRFELHLANDGDFRLDGGAMFGVVPKVLWQRRKPADERNRIRMTANCPLIECGEDLVLVDSGIGDKNDEKFRDIFGLEKGAERLPDSIRRLGYELEDVTHVLQTHLHFDHCGWNTSLRNGRLVPTFPRARYWLERGEVEHARSPSERDRASYDPRNWEPLFEAGVVELFDERAVPIDGVEAVKAPGHNADMCIVLFDGGDGERGVFWADLVPTAAHLPYPWVMGYDLYPLETMANKQSWLPRAAEEGWLCIFEHDPETPLARLREQRPGRFEAEPVPAVPARAATLEPRA